MGYAYVIIGGIDMKHKQNQRIKGKEAKQNRFNHWSKKREEDIKDHERPSTYSLGELYKFNKSKGFLTHRNPQIEGMERR